MRVGNQDSTGRENRQQESTNREKKRVKSHAGKHHVNLHDGIYVERKR